jgi:DNA-binding GntR family transcriptional regulator
MLMPVAYPRSGAAQRAPPPAIGSSNVPVLARPHDAAVRCGAMPRKDRLLLQQAYDELKRRIITLELRPGQRIDEHQLAADLQFSRTPVREAIFLLASEGLVDIGGKAGFTVRPLDLLDVVDLFEAHIVLAKAIAHLGSLRATQQDLDAMTAAAEDVENAIDRRDRLGITSANAELHRREAACAHSRRLAEMASALYDHEQRLSYLCFGEAGANGGNLDEHFKGVREDHAALISAYRARNASSAERVSIAHIRRFRARVQAFLDVDPFEEVSFAVDDFVLLDPATGTTKARS